MPVPLSQFVGPAQFLTPSDLATVSKEFSVTGDGTLASFPLTHDLGTTDVLVRARQPVSGLTFGLNDPYVVSTTTFATTGANSLLVTFSAPVPLGEVRKVTVLAMGRLNALNNGNVGAGLRSSVAVDIASGILAIDARSRRDFIVTSDENVTLMTVQWPEGVVHEVKVVVQPNGTLYSWDWPDGVKWAGGATPTIPSLVGERLIVTFYSPNGGIDVFGSWAVYQ